MRIRRAGILFALLHSLACAAGEVPNYADAPRVTVQDPGFFRALLLSSQDQVLRVALFGDSQETSPWGWGMHYVPYINARLAAAFGPCSETMLLTNIDMVERPQWLATVLRSPCAAPATGIPSTEVLPGVAIDRLSGQCASGDFRAVLLDDASLAVDDELEGGQWIARDGGFVADVLVSAGSEPSALRWSNQPTDSNYPVASPESQGGTLSFPSAGPLDRFRWATTPALDRGSSAHVQLAVRAEPGPGSVDLVGIRFRSPGPGRGILVQSLSRGGQRLTDIQQGHGGSGPMLRALEPRLAVIHLGANDAMEMVDPEDWRSRLDDSIKWIRASMQDPRFPIIVASDLRGGTGGVPFQVIDRMPAIAHELAMADDRVLALNLRRIAEEEFLWGITRHYLADTAHFHPYAQRLLAHAFVGELCSALGVGALPCGPGTRWADCLCDQGSACRPGGCERMLDVEALFFGVPWNGAGASCADGDGDGLPDECPAGGAADINRDGFVNGMDLGILLSSWGSGPGNADVDGSGRVDGGDLGILLTSWSS